jgi:hypothetical protein
MGNCRRVVLESPYSGDTETNIAYARRALLDSLSHGEAPIASHLLYTQVWDDADPQQRAAGMRAGWAWIRRDVIDALVAYTDLGISKGMSAGIEVAEAYGVPVEFRKINRP